MILSSNFPFLVVISTQYYVKCGHEYDFSFDSIYIPCPFHLYLRMCFSVECISLIIGIRPQISLFVTRSKGSIPRQREPCIFMVGSNAVVGMLIVDLFAYDHGSDLHNRLLSVILANPEGHSMSKVFYPVCYLWWISIKFL